ncbi:MAG: hypothetical protein LBH10_02140, partial [Burkholderiaceae bacterium]|nr:hypothetical protein [Burkholderiaceae bacterium]
MKHPQTPTIRRWAYVLCWALLLALAGCATPSQPKLVFHGFEFDGWFDKWADQVDLLAYSYGDQYDMVRAQADTSQDSLRPQAAVDGPMPVGNFLYVKWRIKKT